MDNNSFDIEKVKKKKKSLKGKMLVALLIIVIFTIAYGFYWQRSTQKLRLEAQKVIKKADNYENLLLKVKQERSRCENFITQQEGDFGSFEYCKKFIEWSNKK